MSAPPGRPKGALPPSGRKARSARRVVPAAPPGRPKGALPPSGRKARSARRAVL